MQQGSLIFLSLMGGFPFLHNRLREASHSVHYMAYVDSKSLVFSWNNRFLIVSEVKSGCMSAWVTGGCKPRNVWAYNVLSKNYIAPFWTLDINE